MPKPCHRLHDGRISVNPDFSFPKDVLEAVRKYYRPYYEHFGIRITSLVKPSERLSKLK